MSRDYGKVSSTFWTGPTGRQICAMGQDHQLVALYLMTGPNSNMIQLYHLPLPLASYHLANYPLKGLAKVLQSLREVDFVRFDETTDAIFLPQGAKYQIGEWLKPKDNVVKHIKRELLKWRKHRFYKDFLSIYGDNYSLRDMPPYEGPSKEEGGGPSKPGTGAGAGTGEGTGSSNTGGEAVRKRLYTEDFESFWKVYPPQRKKSKPGAFEAWLKAVQRADPQKIIAAAIEFAASPKGKSLKWCPGPEPWLNQDRWDDDRAVWQDGDDAEPPMFRKVVDGI